MIVKLLSPNTSGSNFQKAFGMFAVSQSVPDLFRVLKNALF